MLLVSPGCTRNVARLAGSVHPLPEPITCFPPPRKISGVANMVTGTLTRSSRSVSPTMGSSPPPWLLCAPGTRNLVICSMASCLCSGVKEAILGSSRLTVGSRSFPHTNSGGRLMVCPPRPATVIMGVAWGCSSLFPFFCSKYSAWEMPSPGTGRECAECSKSRSMTLKHRLSYMAMTTSPFHCCLAFFFSSSRQRISSGVLLACPICWARLSRMFLVRMILALRSTVRVSWRAELAPSVRVYPKSQEKALKTRMPRDRPLRSSLGSVYSTGSMYSRPQRMSFSSMAFWRTLVA
mmetsp:Transcript_24352/g.55554  ORF Transcript_24352/g.55554 Transcript_24352/m.55554 type:complete len:294 (-) Transcript_24352:1434-2315(-)